MRLFLVVLCCVLSACVKSRLSAPVDIGHIQSPELREARYSGSLAFSVRGQSVALLNNLNDITPNPGRDRGELYPSGIIDLDLSVADRTQVHFYNSVVGLAHQISGDPLERSSGGNRSLALSVSAGYNQDSDEAGPYKDEPCACSWHADYSNYSLGGAMVAGLRVSDGWLLYGGPYLNLNFFDINLVRQETNGAWTERTNYHRRLTYLGFSFAAEYSFGARRRVFTSMTFGRSLMHWNDTGFSHPIGTFPAFLILGLRF